MADAGTNVIEAILERLDLSSKLLNKFDQSLLDTPVDVTSTKLEPKHLNTYALSKTEDLEFARHSADYKTLEEFQEAFEGWTEGHFKDLDGVVRKALREALNYKGIYVQPRPSIAKGLADLLVADTLPEWTREELKKMTSLDQRSEAWRKKNRIQQSDPSPPPPPPPPPHNPGPTLLPPPPHNLGSTTRTALGPYSAVPPLMIAPSEEPIDVHKATTFSKLWNNAHSFTGNAYDILDDKIRHFYSTCKIAQIEPKHFHAVFYMMLSGKAVDYYLYNSFEHLSFFDMYVKMREHFDTEVNHSQYHHDWTSTTFATIKGSKEFVDKEPMDALNALFDKLQRCQRALGRHYSGEGQLVDAVLRACRGVKDLEHATFTPKKTYEALISELRASLETHRQRSIHGTIQYYADPDVPAVNMLDRQYHGGKKNGREFNRGRGGGPRRNNNWQKKCYVCGKLECYSTNHPDEERREARRRWKNGQEYFGASRRRRDFTAFLADYEGEKEEGSSSSESEVEEDEAQQYLTATFLSDNAYLHRYTAPATGTTEDLTPADQFVLDRYSQTRFQGILPDSGAAKNSTAGKAQFLALQPEKPEIQLNCDRAGEINIRFGAEKVLTSIGVAKVTTPFGDVDFHILDSPTPFLLSLADMDRLGVELHNITELLGLPSIPIVVCTDSYSLYECLVKLGSTTEKRLMIDITALRQSYERREITEIRWIHGNDNPADAMTKTKCNGALSQIVDDNELTIRLEGWVQRGEERGNGKAHEGQGVNAKIGADEAGNGGDKWKWKWYIFRATFFLSRRRRQRERLKKKRLPVWEQSAT